MRSFEAEALAEVKTPIQQQPRVKRAVMSMKHQEAVQASDFTKKHATNTKAPPDVQQPLLVIKAEIGKSPEGVIHLTFQTLERKNVNLNLNLVKILCKFSEDVV